MCILYSFQCPVAGRQLHICTVYVQLVHIYMQCPHVLKFYMHAGTKINYQRVPVYVVGGHEDALVEIYVQWAQHTRVNTT